MQSVQCTVHSERRRQSAGTAMGRRQSAAHAMPPFNIHFGPPTFAIRTLLSPSRLLVCCSSLPFGPQTRTKLEPNSKAELVAQTQSSKSSKSSKLQSSMLRTENSKVETPTSSSSSRQTSSAAENWQQTSSKRANERPPSHHTLSLRRTSPIACPPRPIMTSNLAADLAGEWPQIASSGPARDGWHTSEEHRPSH